MGVRRSAQYPQQASAAYTAITSQRFFSENSIMRLITACS
jgi:hypothetical protein